MPFWPRCEITPKGYASKASVASASDTFGVPRQRGTSHRIYRMPWQGDPRVNIQNDKGMAKAYQVKQVLKAIERLQNESSTSD